MARICPGEVHDRARSGRLAHTPPFKPPDSPPLLNTATSIPTPDRQVDILTADNERLRTALAALSAGQAPLAPLEDLLQAPPDLPSEATDVINKIRLTDDKVRAADTNKDVKS
jgi:hypothetical protein